MILKRIVLACALLSGLFSSSSIFGQVCPSMPSGLVGFWRGETNTLDALGNYHGTPQGSLGYTNGAIGQAFNMDGNDQIDLGSWFDLQEFTISMWIRPEAGQVTFANLIDNNHNCCRAFVVQLNGGTQGEYGYGTADSAPGILFNPPANEWTHLTFIRRADTYRRQLYINGVLFAEADGSGPINYDGSQFLRLGNWAGGGRHFRGQMDEVAIFSRALSSIEVAGLYAAPNAEPCTKTTYFQTETLPNGFVGLSYSNAIATGISDQPRTFTLTAGTLPTGLTLSSEGVIQGTPTATSTNIFTLTVTDGNGQTTGRQFKLSIGNCLPPAKNLLGWWRGENNANDTVSKSPGILLEGSYLPGKVGTAISFDGVNDYIAVSNAAAFKPSVVTLEAWIFPTNSNGGHHTIICHGSASNDDDGYWLGLHNGELRFWSRHEGYGMHLVNSGGVPLNQWTHVAATFDGAAKRIYVNGKLTSKSQTLGRLVYDSDSVPVTIGSDIAFNVPAHHFFGTIDEVGIYDRALPESEIVAVYNSSAYGKCADNVCFRTTALPAGGAGIPYSYAILAGVTDGPYTFNIVSGELPAGLEFSRTGQFDGTPVIGLTNNLRIRVTDGAGTSAEADFLLSIASCLAVPAPIAWWRAENSGVDEVSTNHLELLNGVSYSEGYANNALKFDGINDYARASNSVGVQPTNFTLEAWVKPDSLSGFDGIIAKGASGQTPGIHGEADTFWLGLVDGYPRLYTFHTFGDAFIGAPSQMPAGRWHHIAATFDGTHTRIFVNGIRVVEGAPSQPLVYDPASVPVIIGQDWGNGAPGASPFHGSIDEVAIYSTAFTSNQVAALYRASVGGKCGAFHISTLSPLPGAGQGKPYLHSIQVQNGTGPFTATLVSGALPPGLTLSSDGTISGTPTTPGTNSFTVTMKDSEGRIAERTLKVRVNARPALPNITQQSVDEMTAFVFANPGTDADLDQTLSYTLTSAPAGATISAAGVIQWFSVEADGPGTNTFTTIVSDSGVPSLTATNTFILVVNEVNVAPTLPVQNSRTVDELTTLTVTNTANDLDIPGNTLSYSLLAAPAGAVINPSTGVITWTPTEAQGPSSHTFTTRVVDNGSPSLSATNSFSVTVNEVNVAPVLSNQSNRTINELTALSVTNAASDSDVPVNTLSYVLLAAPSGALIDSSSGVITWTPAESQGPSTNTFTTKVVDSGSPNLSATNSFIVVVNEVNVAPVLPVQADRTVNEQTGLTVTNTASDPDLPGNSLSYSLLASPSGANIHPTTGVILWNPLEMQGPSTNTFTTRVVDNGSPNLSATNTFTVYVNEVNVAPVLGALDNHTVNAGQIVSFTASATDADRPTNVLSFSIVDVMPGASIDPASGAFTWRPEVSRAGTTNIIRIRVTDNGSPVLSGTNSFIVQVNQLAPVSLTPLGIVSDEFRFQVQGTTGPDYILMGSSNLIHWSDLFTNAAPATPFEMGGGAVTNSNLRFYRVRLAP